ncbi:MAG TPA: LolA-related protein [Burkholderiales bacterium]|nr:LolA-related protein [Burkholderiales bacterium]
MYRPLFIFILFLSQAASAGQADWDLPQLMQSMAQVESSRARFTEEKHLAILTAPLTSSGTLAYSRPGFIEKQVLAPYEERMTADGDVLMIEKKGERRSLALQNYPIAWAFVESIRATLAGDLALLQRFYRIALEGGRQEWRLTLEPLDAQMARYVQTIKIGGAENCIQSVEILETGGDRSVMAISRNEF